MWRASSADQTFSGSFGALLATVVDNLLDDYECFPEELRVGYAAFDRLTFPQKIATIHETILAMLCEDVPKPELYAYNEAFVAGLFEILRGELDYEIDLDKGDGEVHNQRFRKLLLKTIDEREIDLEELEIAQLSPDCDDYDTWYMLVEILEDLVVWDLDFIDLDEMLDMSPQRRDAIEDVVRFGKDYFTAFPDDPSDKEMKKLLGEIHTFLREYLKY